MAITTRPRVPAGVPTGGEFAARRRTEASPKVAASLLNALEMSSDNAAPIDGPPIDSYGNLLGRGGFARNGRGGALVQTLDPDDLYKSGKSKGRPKLYPYSSASSIALQTSTEALSNWKQNRMLEAMIVDSEFADRARQVTNGLDLDSPEGKDALSALRKEADEIAETHAAARRGTFAHWLTEQADNGESVMDSLEHGEIVGIDRETAARIVEGWLAVNEEHGFKSVAVEAALVNDSLRAAGTTDRVIELTKPFTFDPGTGPVTLSVGTVLIGDLKSGKLRLGRDGLPLYWEKYAGQLAAYAGGTPYDSVTHERKPWSHLGVPATPSQDYGVLIHADLEALGAGKGAGAREAFSIFVVDLKRGRALAEASNGLRAAEKDVKAGAFAVPGSPQAAY